MSFEIYKIADKCLEHIDCEDVKHEELTNLPYYKGPYITSILIHYLREIGAYESHESGYLDYGIITKSIYGIPVGRFAMLETLSETQFKITYFVEDVGKLELALLSQSDYNIKVLEKLGYKKKYIIINFNISNTEHFDC